MCLLREWPIEHELEFKDKIPNNDLGIAPAIIPGIGYKKGHFGADM